MNDEFMVAVKSRRLLLQNTNTSTLYWDMAIVSTQCRFKKEDLPRSFWSGILARNNR
jgi:hypothetical protein